MNENADDEGSIPQAAPDLAAPLGDTVTIFFSDIRGFTDYTEREGDEAARQMLRGYHAIVREKIEEVGGTVVKELGDGFMATFRGARPAILCSIAIQRAIAQAKRRQAGEGIEVGIGINTGEPIQEGSDYIGLDVNFAARICAIAKPGQILVAETTRWLAGRIEMRRSDGGTVEYLDRGLHELKGFPEAKRLFEVTWRPGALGEASASAETPAPGGEEIAAFKTAVQRAIGVLTRVLGVTHLDDPAFPALLECQAKASELRLALSRATGDRRGVTAKEVLEWVAPFETLLKLMLERNTLTEERWAQLDTLVARAFADHDDGQLAGGYFLLLEHLENESPTLMRTALDRAIASAQGLEPRVLGPQLYQLLVERGRLRDTYASFVRDVIQVAIPNPGMWADWGVVETDDTTTVISRPPPTVGAIDEQVEQISDPQERTTDRVFDLTLQPLTTRFFYMKIPEKLKTPRDAELRLTADGQPSGRAWHWTLKDSLTGRSDPKLLPVAGIPLAGLGRDHISLWVAVFNPDPDEVVSYELILSAKPARPAAPKWSAFTPPPPPPAARPR